MNMWCRGVCTIVSGELSSCQQSLEEVEAFVDFVDGRLLASHAHWGPRDLYTYDINTHEHIISHSYHAFLAYGIRHMEIHESLVLCLPHVRQTHENA